MKQLELFKNYKYKQVAKPDDKKLELIAALLDDAFFLGVEAGRGYNKNRSSALKAVYRAKWKELKGEL